MNITIDLPSGCKIIIYPWCNKAHFIFPYQPPLTLTLFEAETICRQVAQEKKQNA